MAIAISLGTHAVFLPLAAEWLDREASESEMNVSVPQEVTLPLADWIVVESGAAASSAPEMDEEAAAEEEAEEARKRDLGYVRTTENQQSTVAPDRPDFVSDRNTLASSEAQGAGPDNLPNVEGEDDEGLDVEDRRYRDGLVIEESPDPLAIPGAPGSVPVPPSPQPSEPKPLPETSTPRLGDTGSSASPFQPEWTQPLPPNPDAIALPRSEFSLESGVGGAEGKDALEPEEEDGTDIVGDPEGREESDEPEETSTIADRAQEGDEDSPPETTEMATQATAPPGNGGQPVTAAPSTVDVPPRQEEAFQSETRKTQLDGGAKRRGPGAFDAENTPIGRYRKEIGVAIERAWQARMMASQDFMNFHSRITVDFSVNRWGKVKNVRVTRKAKNAVLTNQTLAAVMEAKLPEMPARVIEDLDGGDLPCFYNFRIH